MGARNQLCGIILRPAEVPFSPRCLSNQQSDIEVDFAAYVNFSTKLNHAPHCLTLLCCESVQRLQKPLEACCAVWHATEVPGHRLLTTAHELCCAAHLANKLLEV